MVGGVGSEERRSVGSGFGGGALDGLVDVPSDALVDASDALLGGWLVLDGGVALAQATRRPAAKTTARTSSTVATLVPARNRTRLRVVAIAGIRWTFRHDLPTETATGERAWRPRIGRIRMGARTLAPPTLRRPDGAMRRVGVEVELGGLSLDAAAEIVRELYGGTIDRKNRFTSVVRDTTLGDFGVEIDSAVLKDQRWENALGELGLGTHLLVAVDDVLEKLARAWIPCEIASPPIPMDRLEALEPLRGALHAAGAKGTRASPLYAFGFQLNPELPSDDAETILRHLQSFVVLHDWLREVEHIDATRALTPFIGPYPIEWRRRIVATVEPPSIEDLIDDYVASNPTRNRALDMLPAFAWLRPERVTPFAREPDRLHPRPTFHYRLPNSCIDEPGWSFAAPWNRWVTIERLAADAPRLARLCEEYAASLDDDRRDARDWIEHVAREVGA